MYTHKVNSIGLFLFLSLSEPDMLRPGFERIAYASACEEEKRLKAAKAANLKRKLMQSQSRHGPTWQGWIMPDQHNLLYQ